MTRLPRLVTLLGSAFLLAACGQLIGLSDFDSVDGEGGEAGEETGGRAGRAGGGAGGNAGTATAGAGGDRGGAGGSTGGSAGTGGTAGDPGTGGTGGSTGGTSPSAGGAGGDAGGGGEPGEAGAPGCREITTIDYDKFVLDDRDPTFVVGQYSFAFLPNLGSSLGDVISMDFYESAAESLNGSATGTFEFGTDIEANYETCARCLRVIQDANSTALEKTFFATSGTLTIDPVSLHMQEYPYFWMSDVTLVEVTIDDDAVSTPKPGGECLYFPSLELDRRPPPAEWTCLDEYYYDATCDCGCGAPDPICLTSYVSACDFCGLTDSCSTDATSCTDINVDQNWTCIQPQPWTCSYLEYADGICDCGCGIADVDCVDSSFATCESCHCDEDDTSCAAATVDPADTTLCLP